MRAKNKLISFIGLGSDYASELLYKYLRLHPEVCVPEEETNFFNDIKIHAKGTAWYESRFEACEAGTKCGELATGYLKSTQTAFLIASQYPDAKLFAVIENPLMTVRVAYVEAVRAKKILPETTLTVFIKQNPEVLTQAQYGRQLVHYFDYYSQNDLMILIASDIRENLLSSISSVFSYIEIDSTFVPVDLKHLVLEDDSEVKKVGLIKRTFKRVNKQIVILYKNIMNRIKPPLKPIDASINVATKIKMPPELETYLKDYFRKDVAQLSTLLHRNLNDEWGI